VLVTLGLIQRTQGDIKSAQANLSDALRLAEVIGPRLMVAVALEGMAGVMAQAGQATLAVQLASVAASLRAEMGTPVRPIDQPYLERTLETARLELGEDDFATLWSQAIQPLHALLRSIPNIASVSHPTPTPQRRQASAATEPLANLSAAREPRLDW